MSTPTPTPWVVDYGLTVGHIKSVPQDAIPGVTGTPTVARYDIDYGRKGVSYPTDEQRANAAHIVKCVNHHDELVAALNAITAAYVGERDCLYESVTDYDGNIDPEEAATVAAMDKVIDEARAILAKLDAQS